MQTIYIYVDTFCVFVCEAERAEPLYSSGLLRSNLSASLSHTRALFCAFAAVMPHTVK